LDILGTLQKVITEFNRGRYGAFFLFLKWFSLFSGFGSGLYILIFGAVHGDSNWVNAGATIILVTITGFYAYSTKKSLDMNENQNKSKRVQQITSKVIVPLYSDLKEYSESIDNETHISMNPNRTCLLMFNRLENDFSSNCDEILLFSHFNDAGFIEHFPAIRHHLSEFSKIKNEYLDFLKTNVPKFIDFYLIKSEDKEKAEAISLYLQEDSYNLFENFFYFKNGSNRTIHPKFDDIDQIIIEHAKKLQLEDEDFKLAITRMQEYDKELLGKISELKACVEILLDKWEEKYYIVKTDDFQKNF